MNQDKLAEKLDLTQKQFSLLRNTAVDNLFAYASQIYKFEDEELPHDKEDVNAVLELFNYRVKFDEDGVMYDLTNLFDGRED